MDGLLDDWSDGSLTWMRKESYLVMNRRISVWRNKKGIATRRRSRYLSGKENEPATQSDQERSYLLESSRGNPTELGTGLPCQLPSEWVRSGSRMPCRGLWLPGRPDAHPRVLEPHSGPVRGPAGPHACGALPGHTPLPGWACDPAR